MQRSCCCLSLPGFVFCTQLSIPPLSAGVKYRKLLLYYSKSCASFFPSLLCSLCVGDFKLYLFFMARCTFKELLQEYLKRQEHLWGRAVSNALQFRLGETLGSPRYYFIVCNYVYCKKVIYRLKMFFIEIKVISTILKFKKASKYKTLADFYIILIPQIVSFKIKMKYHYFTCSLLYCGV